MRRDVRTSARAPTEPRAGRREARAGWRRAAGLRAGFRTLPPCAPDAAKRGLAGAVPSASCGAECSARRLPRWRSSGRQHSMAGARRAVAVGPRAAPPGHLHAGLRAAGEAGVTSHKRPPGWRVASAQEKGAIPGQGAPPPKPREKITDSKNWPGKNHRFEKLTRAKIPFSKKYRGQNAKSGFQLVTKLDLQTV